MEAVIIPNLPIEKIVENDFLKAIEEHELRKEILTQQKEECLKLVITDLTDKEQYALIRATRLNQKAKRIIVEKVCKNGRADAKKAQDKWIELEREFTNIISIGEKHLQEQEDIWDAERERVLNEKKILEEKQYSERSNLLQNYGAKLIDGSFVLDNISYESSLVRETEQSIWEEMMLTKYKSIFDAKEKIRLDNERKLQQMQSMRTTVYKARYYVLLAPTPIISDDELIDMSDEYFEEFKDLHNSNITKHNEEIKKEVELKEQTKKRKEELFSLGFHFNGVAYLDSTLEVAVSEGNFNVSNDDWAKSITLINVKLKEVQENKKLADEKIQQEQEAAAYKKELGSHRRGYLMSLGVVGTAEMYAEMSNEDYAALSSQKKKQYENDIAAKLEEKQRLSDELELLRKKEEEAGMKDKEKWNVYVTELSKFIDSFSYNTLKYKKLSTIAKEKIEEIITLNK